MSEIICYDVYGGAGFSVPTETGKVNVTPKFFQPMIDSEAK